MKTNYDPSKCKNWDKPYGAERFIEEKYPYRPQIIFIENYVETTVFDSKIGGIPYMPADFEYPTVKDGKDKGEPIPFLAQINFRKAPRLTGFPTHGIMQFYCYKDSFYDEFSKQQLEHIKQERYRVIYFPEPDEDDVLKKEEDFPKINLESLCRSECRLDAQYPTFSHISLEDRSIRHSLCPYFNCASVESFEDRMENFEDCIYDKREWSNYDTSLGGYPECVSTINADLYEKNEYKKLFLQLRSRCINIPRVLFFISEQDMLEGNFTKLCLAQ